MSDFDLNKLQGMKLNLNTSQLNLNLAQDMANKINRDNERMVRYDKEARQEKEAEELRRHNEIVNALKEAGEKGATIVIGDNANGIQIQQSSDNSSQTMTNSQSLDYEKAKCVLEEIKSYFDFQQFNQTYGDNADRIKSIVEITLEAVVKKEDEGVIKKSLSLLKDITVGTAGSIIASGILALLGTLPL